MPENKNQECQTSRADDFREYCNNRWNAPGYKPPAGIDENLLVEHLIMAHCDLVDRNDAASLAAAVAIDVVLACIDDNTCGLEKYGQVWKYLSALNDYVDRLSGLPEPEPTIEQAKQIIEQAKRICATDSGLPCHPVGT